MEERPIEKIAHYTMWSLRPDLATHVTISTQVGMWCVEGFEGTHRYHVVDVEDIHHALEYAHDVLGRRFH